MSAVAYDLLLRSLSKTPPLTSEATGQGFFSSSVWVLAKVLIVKQGSGTSQTRRQAGRE